MCGIAGIVNFNGPEDKEPRLRRMLGLIRHRGPDSFGIYMNGPAGLANARLRIIDLETGDQPIHNEDRTKWIVLNGEIFNYPELRKDLTTKGHRFYTKTDTEVLVHLYEDYGPDMLEMLNGQFAFAIWDSKKEILMLARDRMGIRPLFYYLADRHLVFGSEIKALFADESVPRVLDLKTLDEIFTCWSPLGAGTSFKDVYQVPAGHYALFSTEGIYTRPYWQLKMNTRDEDSGFLERSLEEWTEELTHLLKEAVHIRLRADVPVGAYLSGGLDSTFITALAKRNSENSLRTFSIRFADDRFDESDYQVKAVKALKTEHQNILCTEENIGEYFPQIIWHTETPVLRTSPAPLFKLSQLVNNSGFKVVLTGEGADEIFAGYNIFKEDRIRRFWAKNPDSKLRPLLLRKLYPYIFSHQDKNADAFVNGFFKQDLLKINSPAYSHLLRWRNTARLKSFFSKDVNGENGDLSSFIHRYVSMLPGDFMDWDTLSRAQFAEMNIFLPNYLLSSQGDRMTMANSVEGRYPFLDHRVVEFAFRMPPEYRLNGLNEKYILKQAAKNVIPPESINRSKQPYRAPISRCFLGNTSFDYVKELLSTKVLQQTGYFEPKKVSRLVAKCRQQNGSLISERENMALVGILSTQLVDHLFIRDFPGYPIQEPQEVKVFRS